ncbi:MAG: hypothetical protein Q9187_001108 [Circinaria calcarea]
METVGRGGQGSASHGIQIGGTQDQVPQGTNPVSGNNKVQWHRSSTSPVAYDPSADLLQMLEKGVEDLRSLVSCRVCVREMAQLFASRAELMASGESTEDHKKCQEEEATIVERDKANLDERTGGLFRGCFKARLQGARPTIRDEEDGVTRCPNCTWELEDGYCNACGVGYGSDGEEFSGEDLSFSDDGESDTGRLSFSDDHYGHPITDEDADYAALVEMGWNEDISLDEDGQSVHTDYEHTLGELTFGRGAAQGLLGQPIRRNGSSNVVGRRQYAPSMLSDVATTYDGNDHEDEAQTSMDTSEDDDDDDGDSSEEEEEDGSLQDFVADDGEGEGDATEDHSMYNFSPMLGGNDAEYTGQSRHNSHTLMEEGGGEGSPETESHAESDSDGIETAMSRRLRGPSWGISPSHVLGGGQVLPAPGISSVSTSKPPISNRQPGVGRARSERRFTTDPIFVQSESESSDSPMPPPRSRKRRLVVGLSDDDSASDVDTYRPRKRQGSSSGSATFGKQTPVPATIESSTGRTSESYQSPIHIGSSPLRSETSEFADPSIIRNVTSNIPQDSQSRSDTRLNDLPSRQTSSTVRDVGDHSQARNQSSSNLSLRSTQGSPASRGTWPTSSTRRELQSREAQAMPHIEHYSNTSRRIRHDTKTEWRRRNMDRDSTTRAGS